MPMFADGQDPLDTQGAAQRAPLGAPAPDPFARQPDFRDTLGAAFRQNNPVVSVIEAVGAQSPNHQVDPSYNPMSVIKGTPFEQNPRAFVDDPNESVTRARMTQMQQEENDRQTLAQSGTSGVVAALGAGLLDPSFYIPIVGEAHALEGGASFVRTAGRMAALGGGQAAISEGALQASQQSRSWKEGVGNIATNTLLMGLLGGALGRLAAPERLEASEALEAVRRDATPVNPLDPASMSLHDHIAPGESGLSQGVEQRAAELHAAGAANTPIEAAEAAHIEGLPQEIAHEVDGGAAQESIGAAAQRGGEGGEYDPQGALGEQGGGLGPDRGPDDVPAGVEPSPAIVDQQPTLEPSQAARSPAFAAAGADVSDTRDFNLKSFGLDKVPGLGDFNARLSPNLRIYSGSSTQAKRAAADLANTSLRFTMHDRGIPTSEGGALESAVQVDKSRFMVAAHEALEQAYVDHRYGGTAPSTARRGLDSIADMRGQTPDGKLGYKQFKEAVYDAAYSGDQHPIPEVQKAAQDFRANVLDPVKKMAQETLGPDGRPMLSEELSPPKGDKSFVPRMWNHEAIKAKRYQLKKIISDWYESEQRTKAAAKERIEGFVQDLEASTKKLATMAEDDPARAAEQAKHDAIRQKIEKEIADWQGSSTAEAKSALDARVKAEERRQAKMDEGTYRGAGERLTSADSSVDAATRKILASDRDLSRGELEDRADETIDRIIGSPDGRIPYDAASGGPKIGYSGGPKPEVRGSLKSRDFAIPTELVKDFVQRDLEHVSSSFLRTMLPDIYLTRRFGDVDMTDTFRRIQEEYARKIGPETTEAASRKLHAQRDSDIADVATLRDRLRGVHGWNPDPAARKVASIIRDFHNFTSLGALGTSVANRLNDIGAQAVMRNGLQNVFNDAWRPFFKSMLGMSPLAGVAKQQAKEMGVGIDGLLGHLRHNLSDINDNYLPGSKFSRGLAWANDRSMLVNLHGPWTDWMKAMSWVPAQAELGRVADRIAAGSQKASDLARMADAGISPAMAARISQQMAEHSITVDGVRLATADKWTDLGARDAFERAMVREANINVISAGIGQKPTFLTKPLGGLIGQFKGFVAGAHENILLSNLQQRDGRTMQGALVAMSMGMLSYRLYTLLAGQEASPRPQDWIKEGIARSALTGWFNEANNTLAKFTAGKVDYNRLYGADRPLTRRTENSPLSELLGPTYARLEGLTGIGVHALGGHASAADIHQARQMIPLQNLMGFRILGDNAEDGVANALGLKPRNHSPHEWPQ